jgi:hypothetical protein
MFATGAPSDKDLAATHLLLMAPISMTARRTEVSAPAAIVARNGPTGMKQGRRRWTLARRRRRGRRWRSAASIMRADHARRSCAPIMRADHARLAGENRNN